jgi:hypothetical protein
MPEDEMVQARVGVSMPVGTTTAVNMPWLLPLVIVGEESGISLLIDFSIHSGPGFGGRTTAAGMYQITASPTLPALID